MVFTENENTTLTEPRQQEANIDEQLSDLDSNYMLSLEEEISEVRQNTEQEYLEYTLASHQELEAVSNMDPDDQRLFNNINSSFESQYPNLDLYKDFAYLMDQYPANLDIINFIKTKYLTHTKFIINSFFCLNMTTQQYILKNINISNLTNIINNEINSIALRKQNPNMENFWSLPESFRNNFLLLSAIYHQHSDMSDGLIYGLRFQWEWWAMKVVQSKDLFKQKLSQNIPDIFVWKNYNVNIGIYNNSLADLSRNTNDILQYKDQVLSDMWYANIQYIDNNSIRTPWWPNMPTPNQEYIAQLDSAIHDFDALGQVSLWLRPRDKARIPNIPSTPNSIPFTNKPTPTNQEEINFEQAEVPNTVSDLIAQHTRIGTAYTIDRSSSHGNKIDAPTIDKTTQAMACTMRQNINISTNTVSKGTNILTLRTQNLGYLQPDISSFEFYDKDGNELSPNSSIWWDILQYDPTIWAYFLKENITFADGKIPAYIQYDLYQSDPANIPTTEINEEDLPENPTDWRSDHISKYITEAKTKLEDGTMSEHQVAYYLSQVIKNTYYYAPTNMPEFSYASHDDSETRNLDKNSIQSQEKIWVLYCETANKMLSYILSDLGIENIYTTGFLDNNGNISDPWHAFLQMNVGDTKTIIDATPSTPLDQNVGEWIESTNTDNITNKQVSNQQGSIDYSQRLEEGQTEMIQNYLKSEFETLKTMTESDRISYLTNAISAIEAKQQPSLFEMHLYQNYLNLYYQYKDHHDIPEHIFSYILVYNVDEYRYLYKYESYIKIEKTKTNLNSLLYNDKNYKKIWFFDIDNDHISDGIDWEQAYPNQESIIFKKSLFAQYVSTISTQEDLTYIQTNFPNLYERYNAHYLLWSTVTIPGKTQEDNESITIWWSIEQISALLKNKYRAIPNDIIQKIAFGIKYKTKSLDFNDLWISDQNIWQVLDCIAEVLPNITNLDLSDNNLNSLPESIYNLQNLEVLDLGYNNLNSLPESICNLQNLKILDLSHNNLNSLPQSIWNLKNLEVLYLYRCTNLNSLPESIWNLQNLKILDLDGNNVNSLPESIWDLQNLQYLSLEKNQLQELPESIWNLQNLIYLNLGYNNLNSLPESIWDLQNLEVLNLERTNLNPLPESIWDLQNLIYLNLSYNNNLNSLPQSIWNLQNLQFLSLRYTNIHNLPNSFNNLKNSLISMNVFNFTSDSVLPRWLMNFISQNPEYQWINNLLTEEVYGSTEIKIQSPLHEDGVREPWLEIFRYTISALAHPWEYPMPTSSLINDQLLRLQTSFRVQNTIEEYETGMLSKYKHGDFIISPDDPSSDERALVSQGPDYDYSQPYIPPENKIRIYQEADGYNNWSEMPRSKITPEIQQALFAIDNPLPVWRDWTTIPQGTYFVPHINGGLTKLDLTSGITTEQQYIDQIWPIVWVWGDMNFEQTSTFTPEAMLQTDIPTEKFAEFYNNMSISDKISLFDNMVEHNSMVRWWFSKGYNYETNIPAEGESSDEELFLWYHNWTDLLRVNAILWRVVDARLWIISNLQHLPQERKLQMLGRIMEKFGIDVQ